MIRIGIDVGGTFTDFTLLREVDGGEVYFFKLPSTPDDPSEAIGAGLRTLLAEHGLDAAEVGWIGHGTTVATNLVIERRGARTGLITTRGFRDVLELGRQSRPSIYDYRIGKPPALVPRQRRVEVTERLGPDGTVLVELDRDSLQAAVAELAAQRVESVAVCFLHAWRDGAHERAARLAVEAALPGVYVSVSSEILPEFREFERLSTTVINAFIGPRMGTYQERFRSRVREIGIECDPYTIHSNGGLMSAASVARVPVRTCVSGPAAGVVGAAEIGRLAGFPNLVTFDVGGTSTDVSLIDQGRPIYTSARLVAGYPVKTPMIDIHVIGAGGGSIAAIDDAGALKVGPRSAGAKPGPVAYGLGGTEPTITDANLVLGRLDPRTLLGGRLKIDLEAARRAIERSIAGPLGRSVEHAAHGILAIANANMSRAIRSVSIERGHALAEFALCAFGGAGPLHAADVAIECGIPRVLIPREPGTVCARGMLLTDLSADWVRSCFADASPEAWLRVLDLFAEMEKEASAWLEGEGIGPPDRTHLRVLEARYRGQNFEVKVGCNGLGADALADVAHRFDAAHRAEYGYAIPGRPLELVTARLQAIGRVGKAPQARQGGGASVDRARTGTRPVWIDPVLEWVDTPVLDRALLPVGQAIRGPAIVNEMSATTLVLPGQALLRDEWGNLVLETDQ